MPSGGPHNVKPTRLKILQGTHRPDRAHREPKPRPIAPACPSWLDGTARAKWRELKPQLERLGLLTEVDGGALALYCAAWSRYQAAVKRLQAAAPDCPIEDLRRLEISVERGEHSLRLLGSEFGLTPVARGRLDVAGDDADDDWGGILK